MSHRYYDGTIYHKRFSPIKHEFKYQFFMLDIDLSIIEKLKNSFFSINKFNIFSFYSKDHFGKSKDFNNNVKELLDTFDIDSKGKMRFITLPRICGYVFNPVSILILFKNDNPSHLLAEVHNYNGGRVLYCVKLKTIDGKRYKGKSIKDMYVSPFFKRDGHYEFTLDYDDAKISFNIVLLENGKKMLTSTFQGDALIFNQKNIFTLFFKHTLLTLWVVTRTIWQSLKLRLKGLKWNKPIIEDQRRRV